MLTRRTILRIVGWPLALAVVVGATFLITREFYTSPRVTIGAVEDVTLLPMNITIPARIDTGAATSSLDARDIEIISRDEVEFTLPDRYGGQRLRRRVVNWQAVKSSNGLVTRRPVVIMDLVLGRKRLQTEVTLNDRSRMDWPLLVGRNTLNHGSFIVDVTRNADRDRLDPAATRRSTSQPQPLPATRESTTRQTGAAPPLTLAGREGPGR